MSKQEVPNRITIPPEIEAEMTPAVKAFVLAAFAQLEARIKELEEKGQAIDSDKQHRESERVQVIPSPLRKQDPNNWVFKSIPMRNDI